MPNNLVVVTLKHVSGLAKDNAQNTFSIATELPKDSATASQIVTALNSFYGAFDQFLSPTITSPSTIKIYDRADAEPRVPWHTGNLTLGVSASNTIPAEVAVCMSFQGTASSGVTQARRRGRVYLGPWAANALNPQVSVARPVAALITAIQGAGAALKAASNAAAGVWAWDVWSQTNNTAVLVTNGWVDNAWDTQRRRGEAATARSVF